MLPRHENWPFGIEVTRLRIHLTATKNTLVTFGGDHGRRRDIAQRQPDPPLLGVIGIRPMNNRRVVDRDIAGHQLQVHRLKIVNILRPDADAEHVFFLVQIDISLRLSKRLFWVPGNTRIQPFSTVESVPATQRVATFIGSSGQ